MSSKRKIRMLYNSLNGLFWFSTALLAPLYVLYLMERGLGLSEIGLWAGANTLAVVLLELPTGGLADAWGRGRTYASANIIIASSLLLMALIPGKGILFAGAALFGAGRALSSGSLEAWFVDALKACDPESDLEKELGYSGSVTLLALAAGSVVGSTLPAMGFASDLPGGLPPLALPLIGDALLKLILAGTTLALVRDNRSRGRTGDVFTESMRQVPLIVGSLGRILTGNRYLLRLMAGGAVLALGIGSLENLWQPRIGELIGSDAGPVFGLVLSGCFLAAALGSITVPFVSRRITGNSGRTARIASILIAAGMISLSFSEGPVSTIGLLCLVYFLMEGIAVPRKAMLNDAVESDTRATVLSLDSLVTYLGFAGIVGLGLIAENYGISLAWRIVGLCFIPALLLYPLRERMVCDGA